METIFALIALSEGNPLVTGGSTHKGPVMLNFDNSFVVSLKKLWNRKQSSCLWFDLGGVGWGGVGGGGGGGGGGGVGGGVGGGGVS